VPVVIFLRLLRWAFPSSPRHLVAGRDPVSTVAPVRHPISAILVVLLAVTAGCSSSPPDGAGTDPAAGPTTTEVAAARSGLIAAMAELARLGAGAGFDAVADSRPGPDRNVSLDSGLADGTSASAVQTAGVPAGGLDSQAVAAVMDQLNGIAGSLPSGAARDAVAARLETARSQVGLSSSDPAMLEAAVMTLNAAASELDLALAAADPTSTVVLSATSERLAVSPSSALPGAWISVSGSGFAWKESGQVTLNSVVVASFKANPKGQFSVGFTLPPVAAGTSVVAAGAASTALTVLTTTTTTTTTMPPTTTTTTAPTTTTTTTTAPPTTTTTTTTAPPPTTTTTTPTPSGFVPTPTVGPVADIKSEFNVNQHLLTPGWGASDGYPAFRFFCQFSHLNYSDAIVYPGQKDAAHLHMFFGNTGANEASNYTSLRSTGNSTCQGGPINRTAYWMPAIFNGAGSVVTPSEFELYYKAENAPLVSGQRQVAQFPNGLRMIAGARMDGKTVDPSALVPSGAGLVWGWRCDTSGGTTNHTQMPSCPQGSRLTGMIRFPYCWDGKNLDSADHRSHLRYGTSNTWGPCPSTHPIHLPEVTEFVHYKNVASTSGWYLSSDKMGAAVANGSTLHADWYGAWDNPVQDRWLSCIRKDKNMSGGSLCDGAQLNWPAAYSGPTTLTGWAPMR
jgi:hypothetical protein